MAAMDNCRLYVRTCGNSHVVSIRSVTCDRGAEFTPFHTEKLPKASAFVIQSAAEKLGAPRIEFESVRFAYPDAGEDAVEGVSFSIQPGQTLGIIGGTGCGKTTLVRLLTRDYDVTGGAVRVDGTDVREYTSRRLFALLR